MDFDGIEFRQFLHRDLRGGQLEACYNFQQDCLEVPCGQEVLVISGLREGLRDACLTNTGVNIRLIATPVWCPPCAPLSQ